MTVAKTSISSQTNLKTLPGKAFLIPAEKTKVPSIIASKTRDYEVYQIQCQRTACLLKTTTAQYVSPMKPRDLKG